MDKLLSVAAKYRKALAASLPLVLEIVGDFVGVGSPWYAKVASVIGTLAVIAAPRNT